MTNQTLIVPDIHCDHCASSIEGAVGALEGVETVKVQIEQRSVDVTYDDAAVELDAIVTAIEEQGYKVKT
ncbi:MAG: copper ion binding protein [Acidimicrobiia bacterium]|nr:heavy-metal-associated domain-containing protein [Acidimicrobiia bacterium]MDQ3501185.1 copper ion binding protein [Actinomycetota bacterium]